MSAETIFPIRVRIDVAGETMPDIRQVLFRLCQIIEEAPAAPGWSVGAVHGNATAQPVKEPQSAPFHVARVVPWPGGMGPDLDGVVVDRCGVLVISLDGVNVYPPTVSVEDVLGGSDTEPPVSFSWDEVMKPKEGGR